MTRRYESDKRARAQAATRRRIVDATVELHGTVGPMAATVAAVAKRAGVSRVTVYRHFPDEVSLLLACTSQYDHDHPAPDPSPWAAIADPMLRLRTALDAIYAYYSANEPTLANGMDSYPAMPALQQALASMFEGLRRLQGLLAIGWDGSCEPGSLRWAAIGHAIAFATWRSLRHQAGVTNDQAVQLMLGLVSAADPGAVGRTPG